MTKAGGRKALHRGLDDLLAQDHGVSPVVLKPPMGATRYAVANHRATSKDEADFFPTPPWATRALCERVLPALGLAPMPLFGAWEPACGGGHMAEVLREYFAATFCSDLHEYGFADGGVDFLAGEPPPFDERDWDWVITNPPFKLAAQFALRALREARIGAAMLVRTSWLEGGGRYREIFRDTPPLAIAQFSERVPMVKGRWDPEATTATSYCWVVWAHLTAPSPTRFLWIPPGTRHALTRASDVERFAGASVRLLP